MPLYFTKCPRCDREGTVVSEKLPEVNCGQCLFDDIEIIKLEVTPASDDGGGEAR